MRLGEALPLIMAASNRNPRFALGSLGGRFMLLCTIGDSTHADAAEALAAMPIDTMDETQRVYAIFYTRDGAEPPPALANRLSFADANAAAACGLIDPASPQGRWLLIDPTLRVLAIWPLAQAQQALGAFANTPAPDLHAGTPIHAPVLIVPRIFEPEFCRQLIAYYETQGSTPSGVTQQDATGRTFVQLDAAFKRRDDCIVEDEKMREAIMQRIFWRLTSQIERAFMWRPTRMERYLVACYDASSGGFFRAHRDNTTKGTAHRRFAVTINLNANEYDGGDLRFPEYGSRTYRAPTGGAVVFACALLHEATPVTRGKRYAFLPFLYDEAAAQIRLENNKFLDESITPYRE